MQEILNKLIIYSDNIKIFTDSLSKEWFTIELFFKIIVIYFWIVWIWIIIWTAKDIVSRTNSLILQLISVLLVILLTPLWIIIYFLIRPQYTLYEKYEFELLEKEDFLNNEKEKLKNKCVNCDYTLDSSFKVCPMCNISTWLICDSCNSEVELSWNNCPICKNDLKVKLKKNILKSRVSKNKDLKKSKTKDKIKDNKHKK